MKKMLNAQGMSCGHCNMSVEGAVHKLAGVSAAEVNLEAGSVDVVFDDSSVNVMP